MPDHSTLFSYEPHVDARLLRGNTLLVTLGAFTDAGNAQSQIDDHLLNTLPNRIVGRLDMDQVYDYAGRRPEVTLDLDRLRDYDKPEIVLHELTLPDDSTFFLLAGPEPSFQWENVAATLRHVIEQLGIERTIVMQGFPSPVPHTRELPVTRYGGKSEDIKIRRTMPGTFRLRAPFSAVLTLRLAEHNHEVVATVVHVPQYLADMSYPQAALALLNATGEEGGPSVETEALERRAEDATAMIAQQVESSQQVQDMIAALEEQHDRLISAGATAEVPSGNEIAAEVESFLAGLDDGFGNGATSPEDPPTTES